MTQMLATMMRIAMEALVARTGRRLNVHAASNTAAAMANNLRTF